MDTSTSTCPSLTVGSAAAAKPPPLTNFLTNVRKDQNIAAAFTEAFEPHKLVDISRALYEIVGDCRRNV